MKVAWRIRLCGIVAIVAERTRGRAIAIAVDSAFDANYRPKFTNARAVRAPEHDAWAEQDSSRVPWDEADLPFPDYHERKTA